MAATVQHPPRHPVSALVDALQSQVDDLAEMSLWSMGPAETGDTLQALTRLSASLAELELRVAGRWPGGLRALLSNCRARMLVA
jgi:hypothetical protein